MTDDLVTWLREQIAETERIAHEAEGEDWTFSADTMGADVYTTAGEGVAYDRDGGCMSADTATHIVIHDPRNALAQCEAHSRILDFVENNSPHHIEVNTNDHSGDFLGAMFLTLKMRDLLAAVAIAYQHRPGYEDAIATLKTVQPEVRLSLSKEARGDELAARRYKTDPPDGGRG